MTGCRHETSLWGCCTACGLTAEQQANAHSTEDRVVSELRALEAELRWTYPHAADQVGCLADRISKEQNA